MDLEIAGKVALIAASSKGLGRASAEALAREGVRVVITSRHADELARAAAEIRSLPGAADVHTLSVDLSRGEDVARLVKATIGRFGQLDILVTNAGGPKPGSFADLDENDWYAGLDATLWPVVRLIANALPYLEQAAVERGGGRIINIVSTSVKQPIDGLVLSNALRPAVIGLAKSLSRELAHKGILINNVCPGSFDTDRIREIYERRSQLSGKTVEEVRTEGVKAIPVGRLGRPDELGAVIAFLASAKASYITGQTLSVDGGMVTGLFG
jgi:3-oxoacyl-[acyl-carrier protein] reductase